MLYKINSGEDVSINRLKNFAKKYFENLKSLGDIPAKSRAYKNAQYAAAEAGSFEVNPHKARGGAIKKYAQGGAVSSGHQLTYKRR